MPPGIVIIAVGAIVAGIVIVRTISETILRLREQNRHASNSVSSSVNDERIARIEAAVEAIAIEVERISEGQRFTTKLLSEHSQPAQTLMPKPGKFDTPH
jgi:hypothetical protein